MKQLSLDEITSRIVEVVLSEHIISKENLTPKIKALVRVWQSIIDRPSINNNIKTPIGILQAKAIKENREKMYWRNKYKEIRGEENMRPLYDELEKILIEEGLQNPL